MTYELAKKLKDAGLIIEHQDGGGAGTCPKCGRDYSYYLCEPTLSELIEACGEKFDFLSGRGMEHRWSAWASTSESVKAEGSTPEEAVANLWLKLNESK